MSDSAPSLPPIPASGPLSLALSIDNPHFSQPTFLTLPHDVRELIYDAIVPAGPLIELRVHSHTTRLQHLLALKGTCQTLRDEVVEYLDARPLTILCSHSLRPGIMSGIPPLVLAKVETLVIEDDPSEQPNWALLRNVKQICFTWSFRSQIHLKNNDGDTTLPATAPTNPPAATATSHLPDGLSHAHFCRHPPTIRLTWPPLSPSSVAHNNTVLSHAHQFWKKLRIDNAWIRELWKHDPPYDNMPHIRVFLRRVYEAKVVGKDKVVSWHSIVDVDSRKVVENALLPNREAPTSGKDADYIFPYAAQGWWRRELVSKPKKD
ncbi:uncharacterized protein HMPREF1541_01033 [Cyphellophora europaea CBS 101466]|uniref:F-box domain-containing protein n=1 Tax=Cyphellophora europaea (strain CBS 101466) TaxID=1220924 RepID=W2SG30_CYPE1|nr:uncharacterized protein HMPREF1541_01033 [Cyphellophora europaea CBS 101466]ETN46844.1 hypothetical protein HMPREF1541_01033 [Cyphellophora europaea CBS 101466]